MTDAKPELDSELSQQQQEPVPVEETEIDQS